MAVRRARGANGFLAFIYETGAGKVQALASDLPLYDGAAHHFAAVWNPLDSPAHGKMTLYLDNREVATASLAHSDLDPASRQPFRIEAMRLPLIIDEIRFSSGVLAPGHFLTGGLAADPADDPVHQSESILERRDRELREHKARQLEKKKRLEEERNKELEERQLAEEEKRDRRKLGID